MPAYGTVPVPALYPGTQIPVVNNAAVDAGITTTEQFAIAPAQDGSGGTIMILNTTTQPATGQYATTDTAANYMPLSGCVIPPMTALAFNLTWGWMRFTFAVAPTTGSLIVTR